MWVVITRDQCNFCDVAKVLLKNNNRQYKVYNVQDGSSKWVLHLMKKAGLTTLPQVFRPDGSHVGGYKELQELLTEGPL